MNANPVSTWLGLALLADIAGLVACLLAGVDVGPLDELGLLLGGAVAGVSTRAPLR